LPNDGTIISKDANGAVGVTSITVGTGVTIGDGRITCNGSAITNLSATAFPAGTILQVVQTYKTDTFSASLDQGEESGDVTGFTVSITPSSATNKILIMFDFTVGIDNSSTGSRLGCSIYKAGSILTNSLGDANGNRSRVTSMTATNANDRHYIMSGKFLDTAGGTSAITYSIRLRHGRGATCNMYFNRSGTYTDYNYYMSTGANLTVMEVAA
jgi:hypothetical protein